MALIPVDKEGRIDPTETLNRVGTLLNFAEEQGWTDEELYWAVKLLRELFY